ncbi:MULTISPECIES: CpsD/CapB family tyrosine-protein kinase [unclassified Phenylobacterium]|uniref:CpsD/CapB family tyrosine-protein kinase n=1 Tax=unclassified Phenylobacterium TaxID=2640670 RepID=UPI00138F11B5|nr:MULTISPECIES: CpsD/CapB family tyrosine-protein kinase [unclassified Phenylobacterium]
MPRTNEADPNGGASIAEAGIRRGGELSFSYSPSIVTLAAPHAEQAEAIRTLRTHIMAQHVDDGRRGLAICGPSAGVGCSFTAVNLAVALSQIGVNTLLIDGDLRKPSVQDLIRPSQPVIGLRQALGAEEAEDGIIQTSVLPNLSVMFSGGVAPDAQELLASDRFKDLVDEQLRDFDMTIIDTPAANSCADARRISTVVGYSLIVVRRNRSFIGDMQALAAQLNEDRARIVGTVMNEG